MNVSTYKKQQNPTDHRIFATCHALLGSRPDLDHSSDTGRPSRAIKNVQGLCQRLLVRRDMFRKNTKISSTYIRTSLIEHVHKPVLFLRFCFRAYIFFSSFLPLTGFSRGAGSRRCRWGRSSAAPSACSPPTCARSLQQRQRNTARHRQGGIVER